MLPDLLSKLAFEYERQQKQLEATGFAAEPPIRKPEKEQLTEVLDLLLEKLKLP